MDINRIRLADDAADIEHNMNKQFNYVLFKNTIDIRNHITYNRKQQVI